MRRDTEPWWRQAEADLASAELDFGGNVWYAASWFSHQAAEKAIKALYLERHWRDASRVHDLNLLGRHVGAPIDVGRDLAILDPAFGLTRYPNALGLAPVDTITESISRRHIEAARRILQWVKSELLRKTIARFVALRGIFRTIWV